MRGANRGLILAAALAALSPICFGYYHFTYFASRSGPFLAVPAKFDLSALPDKTVSYFISDQAPGPLMPGDSFPAIVSQIRLAAEVWNGVASSDLRVRFGGITSVPKPQSLPGIDVVFDDDMPPGLLAQTRATTPDDVSAVAFGAPFVPIVRSRVQLHRNLSATQQASYADAFFTTLVHEFGHALGLQHTMTSAAMATTVTRATTKAGPLTADDAAGVSLLYPTASFAASTGSIAGRVLLGGAGVNLASVVALSANGIAISSMSHPDGTYRIDGVPPGQYIVYAQPLPPPQLGEATPANIVPPMDPQKNSFPANTGFVAQFFPATQNWQQASPVAVNSGAISDGIIFNVLRSNGPVVYNPQTYAYQGVGGQVAVASPSIQGGTRTSVVLYAPGTVVNGNQVAPGLNVSIAGGPALIESGSVRYYQQGYLVMTLDTAPVSSATPVALAIAVNNDLCVLPAAFTVVPAGPPAISNVNGSSDAQGNTLVTVSGANLSGDTKILFDGAPANIQQVNPDGSLTVSAPPANGSYRANVEALAPDGQTSLQALGTGTPVAFTYALPDNPGLTVNPPFVAAGTDAVLEIRGFNVNFVDGLTSAGFGSSDILIKRAWVTGRDRLLVDVSVMPGAAPGPAAVTVASGLQLVTLNTILQIQPQNPRNVTLRAPVVNQATGLPGVPAGGVAVMGVQGLPRDLTGWVLTIGEVRTSFVPVGASQMFVQVPGGLPPGPAIVRLAAFTGEYIPPIAMQIDGPPPVILAATVGGAPLDANRPARGGDTVTLMVGGLADAAGKVAASGVHVNVGGTDHAVSSVTPYPQPGVHNVQFVLSPFVQSGGQVVSVGVDTRYSAGVVIPVRN
jgi:hypothetical protein